MNIKKGILNQSILEFLSKSKSDIQELKNTIREKYNISISEAALKRRMQHLQNQQ